MNGLLENVQNKNPTNRLGKTPLHFAASSGHFEIFKLIFKEVEDKHPKDVLGQTPLYFATMQGHLTICYFILDYLKFERTVNRLVEAVVKDHKYSNIVSENPKEYKGTPRNSKNGYKYTKVGPKIFRNHK